MKCNKCNYENNESNKYCENCGNELQNSINTVSIKKPINKTLKYVQILVCLPIIIYLFVCYIMNIYFTSSNTYFADLFFVYPFLGFVLIALIIPTIFNLSSLMKLNKKSLIILRASISSFFIIIIFGIYISGWFISNNKCNENLSFSKDELIKELGTYEIINKYEEKYESTGLECRDTEYTTEISFNDIYGNKIEASLFGSKSKKENIKNIQYLMSKVQIVNNLDIDDIYINGVMHEDDIHFKDEVMESYISMYIRTEGYESSALLKNYDVTETNHSLYVTIYGDQNYVDIYKNKLNDIIKKLYEKEGFHLQYVKVELSDADLKYNVSSNLEWSIVE